MATDPILANAKLIAKAWVAAGLYQVWSFPAWAAWAEWNGRFRDDVRRFDTHSPADIAESTERGTLVMGGQGKVGPRSLVVLKSEPQMRNSPVV